VSSSSPSLKPITRQSVADAAYEAVRDALVRGAVAPGEQLVEGRIAEELGVSRSTAREALRRLRDDGLAVAEANRGVFVRKLTLEEVVDLFNLRVGVEGVAIRICTRLHRPTDTLRALVREMDAAGRKGDASAVSDREVAFHEQLCTLSGNEHLAATFRSIAGLTRLVFAGEYAAYADVTSLAAEHVPLIEAIESGDEERAVQALIEHMDIVRTLRQARMRFSWPEGDVLADELVAIAGVATRPPDAARA
jgi:DNA-binding GntR family transcriptional regulator